MSTTKDKRLRSVKTSSASPLSWRVGCDALDRSLINSLGAGSTVPIVVLMDQINRDALELRSSEDGEAEVQFCSMLDGFACIGVAAVRFGERALFDTWINIAFDIYMLGFSPDAGMRNGYSPGSNLSSPQLWFELAKRVLILGGFAVRRRAWWAVRQLAVQITTDHRSISRGRPQYWLRHSLMEAANARISNHSDEFRRQVSPLVLSALDLLNISHTFHPDLPTGDNRLLQSLLCFDLLNSLIVSAHAGEFDTAYVYPSFIYWDASEVEYIVCKLLRDERMQVELFANGFKQEFLAQTLRSLQTFAERKTQWLSWGSTIYDFLNKYPDVASNL
jgi:hypothetical protein